MSALDIPPLTKAQYQALLNLQMTGQGLPALSEDATDLAPILNVARYTQDLTWAYHLASNTATKTGASKQVVIDGRLVTLSQITTGNFFANLRTQFGSASLTPFVVGKKYLVSFYVYADKDQWFWMRPLIDGNDFGHGVRCAKGGLVTRHWVLAQATSTSALDLGASPSVALGSGAGDNPYWVHQANSPALDLYVGGFQIESAPLASKSGIAMIGDSTMAGSSGKKDLPRDFTTLDNREVSTVLSALLRCNVFNRAVGGERLDNMDARWAADMTPLAARSRYAVIQGGINDIAQGRTLAQMQASVQSMAAKAAVDGMTARYLTVTPTTTIAGTGAMETLRQQFNAWLVSTFGQAVIDIHTLVTDPDTGNTLRPEYLADGTHYPGIAKTSIARAIAARTDLWDFPTPTKYHRVLV